MTVTQGRGTGAVRRWRVAAVINASAGTVLHGDRQAICARLRGTLESGHLLVRFDVAPPERMAAAMEAAFDSEADLVLIGGGDGTIQHAAQLAVDSGKTLAILPLGTLNMLARELQIPLDPDQAARMLQVGEVRRIDVAEVGGELCLIKAMAGRLSASIRMRETHRHRLRALAWLRMGWVALRSLLRRGRTRFTLTVDGETFEVRTAVLMVSLNRFRGGLDQPFARDRLDGGRLVVYGLSARATRRHRGSRFAEARSQGLLDGFILAEGQHVTLATHRSHIHLSLDGEMRLFPSPVEIGVLPRALSVLMPPAAESAGDWPPDDQDADAR